jgi:nicotinamide riboside kinase
MFKVVLTGGPSSGKTTLCQQLKQFYDTKLHVCTEAAEMLFRGGFPRLEDPESLKERQYAIFHLQMALSQLALKNSNSAEILLFDRGLLDGLCYWPETPDSFAKKMNITLQETLNEYDLVIQLGVAHETDYQNNAFRPEDLKTSLRLEQKLIEIWGQHKNYKFIPYCPDWTDKLGQCMTFINSR